MWKRIFPAKFWNFPQFLGFWGRWNPIRIADANPGWEGLVWFWPDVPGRRRSGGTGAAGRKSGTKPEKQRGMDWLFGWFLHDDIQIVMSKHFFSLRLLGLVVTMSSLEDEWTYIFTSQLFAWSPPCLELFLPSKTSPCMMCTGSDPLPTGLSDPISELGDPLGNNIYIYTQSVFLSSTYPRYRYIFMVYSVVNEILVIFVMCFLCVVPNLYPTFIRPEGSLRSCRAQVWTQPPLEGKHGRMGESLAQTFLDFPHLFWAGNEQSRKALFFLGAPSSGP